MRELTYPFDPGTIIAKKKALRRALLGDGASRLQKKVAVLGGSTTSELIKLLELFLLDAGIEPQFYESEYAQYYQDAMFPPKELLDFEPDLIWLHTSGRNVANWPSIADSPQEVEDKFAAELTKFQGMWQALTERFHCPILQNNFEMPYTRLLGNRDGWDIHGRTHFTRRLNQAFAQYAQEHRDFYINDLDYLSGDFGLLHWADPAYWNLYKYAMVPEAMPACAFSVAHIVKSLYGKNKKALALDLDNTLWGGVVGDDGVDGIEIGQETGVSQSYYEFQNYVKRLKDIGILLTVCSKNDEENALAGLNHPEGALRPDDFIVIKANWENKDRNIAETAQELNILPEAIVFADDNPAERAIVEAQLPGVIAPQMEGVENYMAAIDRGGYFETTTFSEDDRKRGDMYKANLQRAQQQASFGDYAEYLKSLEMRAVIDDFLPVYLGRITQLTNKSNQFNLTTRRYTPSEMEAVYQSPDYIRLYGKLVDKFGDNGVVAVTIGQKLGTVLDIQLWLMSCRVLKRDMELAMLDELVKRCQQAGLTAIRGTYIPTAKNGMVKGLYESFGFSKTGETLDGTTTWELPLEGYMPKCHVIEVVGNLEG